MYYYDCYLRRKSVDDLTFNDDDENQLQLLGLTALYLACKSDGHRSKCGLDFFVKLSSGRFTQDDVRKMEIDVMSTMQWLLNPPTPQDFSVLFATLLADFTQTNPELFHIILDVANYIIEVAIQYDNFNAEKPSELACAAILISLRGIKSSIIQSPEAFKHSFLQKLASFECISVWKIQSIEKEMRTSLTEQFPENLRCLHQDFDPNGLFYDTFEDPPSLL